VPEKSPGKADPSGVREVLRYLHVGSELAILTAAGAYGGVKLDQYWSLAPWGLVGGTLIGFAFGFYELFRITKNADIR
jgi:F0F1-type ATP synthase assembly protein I